MKTICLVLALMFSATTFATSIDATDWTNHTVCEQGQVQLQLRWNGEMTGNMDWRLVIEESGIVRHLLERQAVPVAVNEVGALILPMADLSFKHDLEGKDFIAQNYYYSLDIQLEGAELAFNAFRTAQTAQGQLIEEGQKIADYFFEDCLQLQY